MLEAFTGDVFSCLSVTGDGGMMSFVDMTSSAAMIGGGMMISLLVAAFLMAVSACLAFPTCTNVLRPVANADVAVRVAGGATVGTNPMLVFDWLLFANFVLRGLLNQGMILFSGSSVVLLVVDAFPIVASVLHGLPSSDVALNTDIFVPLKNLLDFAKSLPLAKFCAGVCSLREIVEVFGSYGTE